MDVRMQDVTGFAWLCPCPLVQRNLCSGLGLSSDLGLSERTAGMAATVGVSVQRVV